jgi:hypothetical protein
MKSVESAQQASEELQNEVNKENLDAFAIELARLEKHLRAMKWALDNPGQYSMDEVISYLSEMVSGKPAAYRTSKEIVSADDE